MDLNEILSPFLLSFKVVLATTFLFITIGLIFAVLIAFYKFKAKFLLELLITLPLIFPPMATGFLLLYFLGERTFFGKFLKELDFSVVFSINGLILAGFISGLPLFVKPIASAFLDFDIKLIQAAKSLGASNVKIFFKIIMPICKKTIITALILSTARVIGEVGISLMLGGNLIGKTDTISLAIYNAVLDGKTELALILSCILIVLSILFYALIYTLERK